MEPGGSRSVNQILGKRELLERYACLFSCHDYRVEQDRFQLSRQALSKLVQKLQSLFPSRRKALHIRDKRALGVDTAAVIAQNRELAREVLRLIEIYKSVGDDAGESFLSLAGRLLPNPGYVSSAVVTIDGYSVILYNVPPGRIRETILAGIERVAERYGGEARVGSTIPVHNCAGQLGFSDDAVGVHMEHYREVLQERLVPSRMPFLDHIIVAMLDWEPWASITKLRDATLLFASRLGEHERFLREALGSEKLRHKYILRHYRMLSSRRVVGRIRLRIWDDAVPLVIAAPAECGGHVYALAAATLGSPFINVFRDLVVAGVSVPPVQRERIVDLLAECRGADARLAVGGLLLPFPFEYYDPIEEEWKEKPVDVMRMLYKFRLAGREGGSMPPPPI